MTGYAVRRLGLALITFVLATSSAFFILNVLPGDVAQRALGDFATPERVAALRHDTGLDHPLWHRYLSWLWNLSHFDLGHSFFNRDRAVSEEVRTALPVTLELAILALIISTVIAIPMGVLSAVYPGSAIDFIVRPLSIVGLALPSFWVGLLVLLLPSLWWNYSPPQFKDIWDDPLTNLKLMTPAACVLGLAVAASTSRLVRATMLEVVREDYVRTARAKGLAQRTVVIRHALRNAMLPVITLVSLQFAGLLGGAIIIEGIFGIPGIGTMALRAISQRDYALVEGFVVVNVIVYTLVNLAVDLMAPVVDPRIRLA